MTNQPMTDIVEEIARAICCHNGCSAKDAPESEFTVCQAASYMADARAAYEVMARNDGMASHMIKTISQMALAGRSPQEIAKALGSSGHEG